MLLPLLLIILSTAAAAIFSYGTHPKLAEYSHGLDIIMLARRLEWPLVALSLLLCMALLGLVISNKRRAWWLIGLAPVLALFVHHFSPPASQRKYVVEFSPVDASAILPDGAWVVGVVFEDQTYALPYSSLYVAPVVFITDYDKRMVLFWSAHANRAVAYRIAREFRPRDLQVVCTPANTVLLYDSRLGEFIHAVTGTTSRGEKPVGFTQPVTTVFKSTWRDWKRTYPNTKLMQVFGHAGSPTGPILPTNVSSPTRVAYVACDPPAAIRMESGARGALNTIAGSVRLLLVRDPGTNRLRAFDRNAKDDLIPTFEAKTDRKFPDAVLGDSDSGSLWTIDGKAIEGPLKGAQLKEYPVEEDVYWEVLQRWYPQMKLAG